MSTKKVKEKDCLQKILVVSKHSETLPGIGTIQQKYNVLETEQLNNIQEKVSESKAGVVLLNLDNPTEKDLESIKLLHNTHPAVVMIFIVDIVCSDDIFKHKKTLPIFRMLPASCSKQQVLSSIESAFKLHIDLKQKEKSISDEFSQTESPHKAENPKNREVQHAVKNSDSSPKKKSLTPLYIKSACAGVALIVIGNQFLGQTDKTVIEEPKQDNYQLVTKTQKAPPERNSSTGSIDRASSEILPTKPYPSVPKNSENPVKPISEKISKVEPVTSTVNIKAPTETTEKKQPAEILRTSSTSQVKKTITIETPKKTTPKIKAKPEENPTAIASNTKEQDKAKATIKKVITPVVAASPTRKPQAKIIKDPIPEAKALQPISKTVTPDELVFENKKSQSEPYKVAYNSPKVESQKPKADTKSVDQYYVLAYTRITQGKLYSPYQDCATYYLSTAADLGGPSEKLIGLSNQLLLSFINKLEAAANNGTVLPTSRLYSEFLTAARSHNSILGAKMSRHVDRKLEKLIRRLKTYTTGNSTNQIPISTFSKLYLSLCSRCKSIN